MCPRSRVLGQYVNFGQERSATRPRRFSMSLDRYIAGPNGRTGNTGGDGCTIGAALPRAGPSRYVDMLARGETINPQRARSHDWTSLASAG